MSQNVFSSKLKIKSRVFSLIFLIIFIVYFCWHAFSLDAIHQFRPFPSVFLLLIFIFISLVERRVYLTDQSLKSELILLGKIKLSTLQEVLYAEIDRIEFVRNQKLKLLSVTTLDRRRIGFNLSQFSNVEDMLSKLSQYVNYDLSPIIIDAPATRDVGKRPLYVLAFSGVLIVFAIFTDKIFQQQLHTLTEHYSIWLFVTIPIAALLIYPWIKDDHKG